MSTETLKKKMQEKNLSAGTLADTLGLQPQTVSEWLSGKKEPYPAIMPALCKALGCEESDLTNGEKAEPAPDDGFMPKPVESPAAKEENPGVKPETKAERKPEVKVEPKQEIPKQTAKPEAVKPAPKPVKPAVAKAPAATPTTVTVAAISKELTALPKPLAKTADADAQKAWADELVKSLSENIAKLASVATVSDGIPERYRKLIEAASSVSDESIEVAISVLKRFK